MPEREREKERGVSVSTPMTDDVLFLSSNALAIDSDNVRVNVATAVELYQPE